jgi:diacylglycerol kinase family enzyme
VQILDPGALEVLEGTTVFLFNLPRYALGLPFAPNASQDDGLLDLVVFRKPGAFQALYYLWRVFRRTHFDHPEVFHRRVRCVRLTARERVPTQIDGDPAGFLAPSQVISSAFEPGEGSAEQGCTIEVVPGAVDLLVPDPAMASGSSTALVRSRVLR